MTWFEHKKKLNKAIQQFLEKDKDLLERSTNERTISSRLGYYLSLEYEPNLQVDCEYNRKGADKKRQEAGNLIYPDILVHERGNDNNNVLVIEIKKVSNTDIQSDQAKLIELTHPDKEYRYHYGIHLVFDTEKISTLVVYTNGSIDKQKTEEIYR